MLRYLSACLALSVIGLPYTTQATPSKEPANGPKYPFVSTLVFAKQGGVLVWGETAGHDRARCTVSWCDADTGRLLKPLSGFKDFGFSYGSIATSSDGKYLAATPFPDDGFRVWDLTTDRELMADRKFENSEALAFVPGNNTLIVKHSKYIVAYDVPSLIPKGKFQITFTGRVFGGSPQNESIAVSADGKRLAGFFNGVRLWDVATRRELAEIQPATDEFKKLAISPDGNMVAYTKRGPTTIWDYTTKAERFRLDTQTPDPTVAFSPAGDLLATSNRELGLHFIDVKSGEVIRRFAQFAQGAYPVVFSPDGKRIAAAWGGEIRIIDLDTEAEIVIKIPPLEQKKDQ